MDLLGTKMVYGVHICVVIWDGMSHLSEEHPLLGSICFRTSNAVPISHSGLGVLLGKLILWRQCDKMRVLPIINGLLHGRK